MTIVLCSLLLIGVLAVAALWILDNTGKNNIREQMVAGQNNQSHPQPDHQMATGTVGQRVVGPDNHPAVGPVPTDPKGGGQNDGNQSSYAYSIAQATSDQAQLNTIAFSGLGFLTGDLTADSFLPPGKVADYFGFQYQRDVTQSGKGHDTDFVTNCANNVLYILSDEQKAELTSLATAQTDAVNQYAIDRYPLMVAFRRQLDGDIPAGASGLSEAAVENYSAGLYMLDANISIQRAQMYANVINSLNATQRQYLDDMIAGGFSSWPTLKDPIDKATVPHDVNVLIMTYAGDIYSWYAGNVTTDTYFCPERQGGYFGGFYIKDAPAIGNAGYTISESITGDSGAAFLRALNSTQQPLITDLATADKDAVTGIVDQRTAISAELRRALSGETIDVAKVMSLAHEYGRLDGEISYNCAMAFSQVGQTLTTEQRAKLMDIRNLASYPTQEGKIYLYSDMTDEPPIPNTDFLFK